MTVMRVGGGVHSLMLGKLRLCFAVRERSEWVVLALEGFDDGEEFARSCVNIKRLKRSLMALLGLI